MMEEIPKMTYATLTELPEGTNISLTGSDTPDLAQLDIDSCSTVLSVFDAMILREGLDQFIAQAVGAYV